jgi:hypothetical protein
MYLSVIAPWECPAFICTYACGLPAAASCVIAVREQERLARVSNPPKPEGVCCRCGSEDANLFDATHGRSWCAACYRVTP